MRIGFYGMPTSGKTHILERVDFMEVLGGTKLLRLYDPDFDKRDEAGRDKDRAEVAKLMMAKDDFIMDGHYSFGDEIAFTEEEGQMYDRYIYLYIDPKVIHERMLASPKNQKHLGHDEEAWQNQEIQGLREYCHAHNKDFYVIDNPPTNTFEDVSGILDFIHAIRNGYSCTEFAKQCAEQILKDCSGDIVTLLDGDKTLTTEDTSGKVFRYKTHLYDGNFYTGYQAWQQNREFQSYEVPELTAIPVGLNQKVLSLLQSPAYILTSGHDKVWRFIAKELNMRCFYGTQMSAETKLYITKYLQAAGKKVIAFGDGMNDYYMLLQADAGYLVTKADGSVSRSLKGKNLEGLNLV